MSDYKINFLGNKQIDLSYLVHRHSLNFYQNQDLESKELYEVYDKLKTGTPEEEKMLYESNPYILKLYDILLKPFLNNSLSIMHNNFQHPDPLKEKEALSEAKHILQDVLGVSNVNIAYDYSSPKVSEKYNILICIDKMYYTWDDVKNPNPLDFTLEKGEFYKFVDSHNIAVSIIIPVQILKDLINENYKNINTINPDYLAETIRFNENSSCINMAELRKKFAINFINNYRLAIYAEARRERIYIAIYNYLKLLKDDEENLLSVNLVEQKAEQFVTYHSEILKTIVNAFPITVEIFKSCTREILQKVHPLVYMKSLINPSPKSIRILANELALDLKWINDPHYNTYDSLFDNINRDKMNETANVLSTVICLKRLIPLILLSNSPVDNKGKRIVTHKLFKEINEKLIPVTNYADMNLTVSTISFANIIKKDSEMLFKFSNPLVESRVHKYLNRDESLAIINKYFKDKEMENNIKEEENLIKEEGVSNA